MVGHVILYEIEGDGDFLFSLSHFDGIFTFKAVIMLLSCGALLGQWQNQRNLCW